MGSRIWTGYWFPGLFLLGWGRLPGIREQFRNSTVRMRTHPVENIFEVGKRLNLEVFATLDHGHQDCRRASSRITAKMKPVLAAYGDRSQSVLACVSMIARFTRKNGEKSFEPQYGVSTPHVNRAYISGKTGGPVYRSVAKLTDCVRCGVCSDLSSALGQIVHHGCKPG